MECHLEVFVDALVVISVDSLHLVVDDSFDLENIIIIFESMSLLGK